MFGNRPRYEREFKTINTLQRKECSTTGSITTALLSGVVATPCGSSRISRTAEGKYFNGRSSRASFGYYVIDKHQSADGAPLLELFFHRRSRYAAGMPAQLFTTTMLEDRREEKLGSSDGPHLTRSQPHLHPVVKRNPTDGSPQKSIQSITRTSLPLLQRRAQRGVPPRPTDRHMKTADKF